jgi:hypothetical protein
LAAAALDELPVPRRCQTELALSRAHLALGETAEAKRHAVAVLQVAGSRGFRLMGLEARALLARLGEGHEARVHRGVGQELARDFTHGLPPDLARAFMRRPFLKDLEEPG